MNDLMEFLTSTEIIVVYVVVAVAFLLCFIIYLFDKSYYKRKRRQNTRELNKLVEQVDEELDSDNEDQAVYYNEPVLEKLEQPQIEPIIDDVVKVEDNLEYTAVEPDVKDAQEELQKLTEALEKAEEEANKNIELTTFEEEQEQNAIISLDELMSKGRQMYENDEFSKYEDEGNEPISLADLEAQFNAKNDDLEPVIISTEEKFVQEQLVLDDFNSVKVEDKPVSEVHKFKNSPVISPVFGIERVDSTINELELENTANYEKLDEEIKKTNEFLMTLKELQKNLD